jgi:hypothetical protein
VTTGQGNTGEEPIDKRSRHTAAWFAWVVCALSLTLTALCFLLIALNVSWDVPAYAFWPELTSLAVGYSVIGAIIASRLPNHPIGWICCAIGLIAAVDHFAGEYAVYALLALATRFRAVGRCSGSRSGSGCYLLDSSYSCSYCSPPVGCPVGAGDPLHG